MKLFVLPVAVVMLFAGASCSEDSFVKQNKETIVASTTTLCSSANVILPTVNQDPTVQKGLQVACELIKTLAMNISSVQFDTEQGKTDFFLQAAANQTDSLSPEELEQFRVFLDAYNSQEVSNVE